MPKKSTISKLKRNILTIAIAVIFALFVGYGIETFYDSPRYEDFCDQYARPVPLEKENVTEMQQQIEKETLCWEEYDAAREPYEKNVFIISLIIGLIATVVGGVVLKLESVSSGIMAGGVLTTIYGTIRYWGHLQDTFRFLILGIVLAVLIWIGYKKFKE